MKTIKKQKPQKIQVGTTTALRVVARHWGDRETLRNDYGITCANIYSIERQILEKYPEFLWLNNSTTAKILHLPKPSGLLRA